METSMRILKIIITLSAVAIFSSCNRGNSPGSAQQSDQSSNTSVAQATSPRIADPCKLLTQNEASEAISTRLGPGEMKTFRGVTRCAFFNTQNREEELWLDVQNETAVVTDVVLFDSLSHGPDVKPVSGIGDRALWAHSQIGTFLYILKGGNMLAIGLPRTMAAMTPAVEKAGKLMASRM
jgi:hypothetical protein